jgi:hypothetical protein
MKPWLALLGLGLSLIVLGALERDDPALPLPLRQRLDGELASLRSTGPPAELLVVDGRAEELKQRALARAKESGATVIALSADGVAFVPSPKDAELITPRAWSDMAQRIAWPYLRNDDVRGAAMALVRAYSVNLIAHGRHPARPPLPPIFLPDTQRAEQRSTDVHLTGSGIALLIVALAGFLAGRAQRRRTES